MVLHVNGENWFSAYVSASVHVNTLRSSGFLRFYVNRWGFAWIYRAARFMVGEDMSLVNRYSELRIRNHPTSPSHPSHASPPSAAGSLGLLSGVPLELSAVWSGGTWGRIDHHFFFIIISADSGVLWFIGWVITYMGAQGAWSVLRFVEN